MYSVYKRAETMEKGKFIKCAYELKLLLRGIKFHSESAAISLSNLG